MTSEENVNDVSKITENYYNEDSKVPSPNNET